MHDVSIQISLAQGALRGSLVLRSWVMLLIVWLCNLAIIVFPFSLAIFSTRSVEAADNTSLEMLFTNGSQAFRRGAFAQAARYWQDAAQLYEDAGKLQEYSSALIALAQAYQALGQYTAAHQSLDTAETLAKQTHDQKHLALVQSGLGGVALASGAVEEAARHITESLMLARQLGDDGLTANILNNQGAVLATRKDYAAALRAYQESILLARKANLAELTARLLTNAAKAALFNGQPMESKTLLDQASSQTWGLVPSHEKAYGFISIGLLALDLRSQLPDASSTALTLFAAKAFAEASKVADTIGDLRAASYARGYWGKLYEEAGKVEDALQLTRQAVFAAQQANASESLYLWQWQNGRLLKKQQQKESALAAYQRAVFTLQSIRQALLLRTADPHFSFHESVEPVYFELVDLLLQRAASEHNPEQRREDLLEARKTVELLKVAELRDYFQDECVDAARAKVQDIDKIVTEATAVIYPIPLPDRLELLLTLPGGQLKSVVTPVGREALTEQVRAFRRTVVLRSRLDYRPHAQQLYNWLIRPLEPDLTAAQVDTLVFVPHGALRTIPMAALSPDGVEFLISKYAIAVTPGLTLTDPQPLRRDEVKLLAGGLTESVQNFPPLRYVGTELRDLQSLYGSKPLLNRDFAAAPVEQALRQTPFSIMHFATHGQFSGDPRETFILTYDERLTLDRLQQLVGIAEFRTEPIELLTLSACETAAGDDRAALGLAGVAIKAGARSALATLWTINDEAAATLVTEFYHQLQDPSVSRAAALQRAQLKLLHDQRFLVRHPGAWSQFLLINNWL